MKRLLLILLLVPMLALAQEGTPQRIGLVQLNDSLIRVKLEYAIERPVIDTVDGLNVVVLTRRPVIVPELTRVDTVKYTGDFYWFQQRANMLPYYYSLGDSARQSVEELIRYFGGFEKVITIF